MDTTSNWTKHGATGQDSTGGAVYVSPVPEPETAKIWFFTRLGGVSKQPFDSLNVSVKVGDDRRSVEENLSRIKNVIGGGSSAWVRQVAGDKVVKVDEPGFAGEADAIITGAKDLPLVVAVADCVPVALVGKDGVGMVHSGWRGTLSGVSGKAAAIMGDSNVQAYIGPCIRRCCYEVSREMAGDFSGKYGPEVVDGRYLSLPAAITRDLRESGVEEVHDTGLCTACNTDLFYSHRKEKPTTGRSLAVVAKVL